MINKMANNFKYSLYEKGIKKGTCPSCNQKNKFRFWINIETLEKIGHKYGKCDRVNSCGYQLDPDKEFITDTNYKPPPPKPASFLNIDYADVIMGKKNNFNDYLYDNYDKTDVDAVIEKYKIGTSKYWDKSTVFWQIDNRNRLRGGKIMLYDKNTGKRVKNNNRSYIQWVHSVLKLKNYNLEQCFFGEHLIASTPFKPVAIVESEKTAIICDLVLGKYTWIATGSKHGLNFKKLKVLKDNKVKLFPDNDALKDWSKFDLPISKFLVDKGITDGYDLADYLTAKEIERNIYYDATFTMADYEICKELILKRKTDEPKDCFDLDGTPITQSQSDALIKLMNNN